MPDPTRILWRSSLGADIVAPEDLPEGTELRVIRDMERALEARDWPQVLIDGSPRTELLDGERLERVVVPYAGVRESLRAGVADRPHLKLHNSHFNAPFVAQHAVALLLAATNRLRPADAALRRGDWEPRYERRYTSLDLRGKRTVLVGYGAIGRELRPRLAALGCDLVAVRRRVPPDPELPTYAADELRAALGGAHVAVVSLPGTAETRDLIGERELAAMAPGAVLVNVGRGDVVDDWALWRALDEGHLGGAGLDVWWRYPEDRGSRRRTFPAAAPLHRIPNLVMSPHRANQVDAWESASVDDVARTLAALRRGEERNRVDVAAGY